MAFIGRDARSAAVSPVAPGLAISIRTFLAFCQARNEARTKNLQAAGTLPKAAEATLAFESLHAASEERQGDHTSK